jgi:hypothetical protein
LRKLKIMKINTSLFLLISIIAFLIGDEMFLNPCVAGSLSEDTTAFNLPDGFTRSKVYAKSGDYDKQFVGTFFRMENTHGCKIKLVSRKLFDGTFNFENIEKQCQSENQDIVMQVAGAFTPDWKVIEGYALQDGQVVGQDSCLGENKGLIYKGLLLIKEGCPVFKYLDDIPDPAAFAADAIRNKYTLFQQAAPILNGEINKKINLPGTHKRRFFVEAVEGSEIKFGIVNFHVPMKFSDAVEVLTTMGKGQFIIRNAIYLDMGSVSEGYFYDENGQAHLVGDPSADITKYTNVLVMYKNHDPD